MTESQELAGDSRERSCLVRRRLRGGHGRGSVGTKAKGRRVLRAEPRRDLREAGPVHRDPGEGDKF